MPFDQSAIDPRFETPQVRGTCYFVQVYDDTTTQIRKLHAVRLHCSAVIFTVCACSPLTSTQPSDATRRASVAAMCLIPLYDKIGDAAAAAEPAASSVRKKLETGAQFTIVDLAPLVELADLVLDVRACAVQVQLVPRT